MRTRSPYPHLVLQQLDPRILLLRQRLERVRVDARVAADVGAEEARAFCEGRVRGVGDERVGEGRVVVVGLPFDKVVRCEKEVREEGRREGEDGPMSKPRGFALAYSKSTTMIRWCGTWILRSSARSSPSLGVRRSKFPYCVSLCEKTRLLFPSFFSHSCTKVRYNLTCCSNSGRLSAARRANVRAGEERGATWSGSARRVEEREGGGGARRSEKPGRDASWSSSLRTSLASRVQRVMFSQTPSLSFARRPRELIRERLRFFESARDSELPPRGRSNGELVTGVPYSEPKVAREVVDPADEFEYAEVPKLNMDDPDEVE